MRLTHLRCRIEQRIRLGGSQVCNLTVEKQRDPVDNFFTTHSTVGFSGRIIDPRVVVCRVHPVLQGLNAVMNKVNGNSHSSQPRFLQLVNTIQESSDLSHIFLWHFTTPLGVSYCIQTQGTREQNQTYFPLQTTYYSNFSMRNVMEGRSTWLSCHPKAEEWQNPTN